MNPDVAEDPTDKLLRLMLQTHDIVESTRGSTANHDEHQRAKLMLKDIQARYLLVISS